MHVFFEKILQTKEMKGILEDDAAIERKTRQTPRRSGLPTYTETKKRLLQVLTSRQKELGELLFQGHRTTNAAELLGMAEKTRNQHSGDMYERFKRELALETGTNADGVDKTGMGAAEYLHAYAFLTGNHGYLRHIFDASGLTSVERAVTALSAIGMTQEQIAKVRTCSAFTVKRHVLRANRKILTGAKIDTMEKTTLPQLICLAAHALEKSR